MEKFNKFMSFLLNHKLHKLTRKMSEKELADLHYSNTALFFHSSNITDYIRGSMAIYATTEELKKRYPNSKVLKEYDYSYPLDMYNIIGGN